MARRKSRKGSYRYTAKRRVALKKAQTISARKRLAAPNKNSSGRRMNSAAMGGRKRTSNLGRNIAIGTVAVGAVTAGGIVARHKLSGSSVHLSSGHPLTTIPIVEVSGKPVAFDKHGFRTHAGVKTTAVGTRSIGRGGLTRSAGHISYTAINKNKGTFSLAAYNHKPLNISRLVAGKQITPKSKTHGLDDHSIEGGIKYRGGVVVEPISQFIKGKPVSIESKEIPSPYVPQLPRSQAHVGGVPLNQYLASLRHKYPKVYSA